MPSRRCFKRLTRETGIHVNPHKFRHTFATRALSAGVDVMALQKALGHTTLAMEREAVRELEEAYRVEVEGKPVQSLLWRLVSVGPMWQRDIEEDTGA
jgi:integrase